MITVGHDSEFGLMRNNSVVSALDVLSPFEVNEGRVFPDNLNCEIAINPVTSLKDFKGYTNTLLNVVTDLGFTPLFEPTIEYPKESLKHKDAFISACNPDFSSYFMVENTAPDFSKNKGDSVRSCGAHIHVGDKDVDPNDLARWMDLYVTLPLLKHERPSQRRSMYGKAGCLRYKPYGIEYRTLSNVWLKSEEFMEFVWEGTFKALTQAKKSEFQQLDEWFKIPTAIDEHNIELAEESLNYHHNLGVSRI